MKISKENLESLLEAKHKLINIWAEMGAPLNGEEKETKQFLIDSIVMLNVIINKYLPLPENKA